jgi:hypothetical protein
MVVGVYSVNAFMNKKRRERKKQQAEHKADTTKPEIFVAEPKSQGVCPLCIF